MKKDQTYKTKVMEPEEIQSMETQSMELEKVYSFPSLRLNIKAKSLAEAYEKLKDLTSNQN